MTRKPLRPAPESLSTPENRSPKNPHPLGRSRSPQKNSSPLDPPTGSGNRLFGPPLNYRNNCRPRRFPNRSDSFGPAPRGRWWRKSLDLKNRSGPPSGSTRSPSGKTKCSSISSSYPRGDERLRR